MKIVNRLLLAATIAVAFLLTDSAIGHDASLSPKAKALAHDLRKVPGVTPDLLNRSVQFSSPRWAALRESLRKAPGTTPDLLARQTPPALPRPLVEIPGLVKAFEIAPLK
ncbi:MAG: hypothetical protein HYY24_05595 [Verrucomicrobia bacterium]|nr:hypothetical protein [Verrucomicrobiota bacterium]